MTLKQTVLKVAAATGLGAAARRATRRSLRILCYHGLWVTPGYAFGDCTFIAPEQFEARMARLKRSGLPVLPLGEAVERLGDGTLPDAAVVITIDDGWVSTFTHMLPVLEAYGFPATLYATTWYAGRDLPVVNVAVDYLRQTAGRWDVDPHTKTIEIEALPIEQRLEALRRFGAGLGVDEAWLELRQFHIMSAPEFSEAQRRGLDIQLHTHRHIEIDRHVDELPRELAENRAFLAAALGETDLVHFCHPSGTNHPRARALLAENGIRSATLVTEGLNAPGTDPLALRRFLDGRRVSDAEFDAYLSGLLHYTEPLRRLRVQTQSPQRADWVWTLRVRAG
ncbi:MAG TPA: polysaccharide deacetylase family protein [Allosphingosinicella sp.]|jgi:peptidoglycan/xylan/chitin deacetylase (PgdA/CDA1 family)|nr:polysaccharide deacetylase family protein [Allosphingosinicella sp.]